MLETNAGPIHTVLKPALELLLSWLVGTDIAFKSAFQVSLVILD
jgi:hypothetical protein